MELGAFLTAGLSVLRARWYLRQATSLGERVRLEGRPVIRIRDGQLVIGARAVLLSTLTAIELVVEGGRLEIGARTFINYGCSLAATQLVRIGQDCKIGKYCIVIDNNFHHLEADRRNERPAPAPVILEDNVWLGSRVIVLPGVTIGAGSVIGAGGVVVKDIPAHSLAVGVPAKVVRSI